MATLMEISTWNFENKALLLEALLHSLNERHAMAENSYRASILSSHEHRFYHEQALACELFGMYLVENAQVAKGIEQLQIAWEKYTQWGATKKAGMVKDLIGVIQDVSL